MPPPIQNPIRVTENVKKVRILRNGDAHFKGISVTVRPRTHATLESLLDSASKGMSKRVYIPPRGFDSLFKLDGTKVKGLDDLEDGESYACSGAGEPFKWVSCNGKPYRQPLTQDNVNPNLPPSKERGESNTVPTRIITVIRNGSRPRKVYRVVINKSNARSLEQVLNKITRHINLNSGAVRKVFNQSGCQVDQYKDFFALHHIFYAYGLERPRDEDFVLDKAECKALQTCILFKSSNASPVCRHLAQVQGPSSDIPRQITTSYNIGRVIGEGGFGLVRECLSKGYRQTSVKYAMKIVTKSKCTSAELENEVTLLSRVMHPNIMRVFHAHSSPTHLYLVMELMDGDLEQVIDAGKTPELEAAQITSNIASALFYLHSLLYVHRDVKPGNFLVGFDRSGKRVVKLSDFGFAISISNSQSKGSGTLLFMAPERLREEEYDYKVDTWAAGVTVYLLLTAEFPFEGVDGKCLGNIRRGTYTKSSLSFLKLSNGAKDLIERLLHVEPEKRLSSEDILKHPWLPMLGEPS